MNLLQKLRNWLRSPDRDTQLYKEELSRIEQSIKFHLSDLVNLTSELANLKNEVKGMHEDLNTVKELLDKIKWLE